VYLFAAALSHIRLCIYLLLHYLTYVCVFICCCIISHTSVYLFATVLPHIRLCIYLLQHYLTYVCVFICYCIISHTSVYLFATALPHIRLCICLLFRKQLKYSRDFLFTATTRFNTFSSMLFIQNNIVCIFKKYIASY